MMAVTISLNAMSTTRTIFTMVMIMSLNAMRTMMTIFTMAVIMGLNAMMTIFSMAVIGVEGSSHFSKKDDIGGEVIRATT